MGGDEVTLVDTSSWIEFLRGHQSAPALRVKELIRSERAGWCDLIAVELWNGVRSGGETKALTELEREVTLFNLEAAVWQKSRRLAVHCRKSGITVPTADLVITACARHYGLDLEHCDGHFDKILPVAATL